MSLFCFLFLWLVLFCFQFAYSCVCIAEYVIHILKIIIIIIWSDEPLLFIINAIQGSSSLKILDLYMQADTLN